MSTHDRTPASAGAERVLRHISRRSALQAGGLAALAAGLLGTTTAPAVAAGPLTLGTTTNMADIEAEVAWRIADVRELEHAVETTKAAVEATLTDEQRALFETYVEAEQDREFEQTDLNIVEPGRHVPGLHTGIWAIWRHMIESRHGECCRPAVNGGES